MIIKRYQPVNLSLAERNIYFPFPILRPPAGGGKRGVTILNTEFISESPDCVN